MAEGKKQRKFGRAARRPGTAAYKMGNRAQVNKDRKIAKNAAFKTRKHVTHKPKVARGTARAIRRGNSCVILNDMRA